MKKDNNITRGDMPTVMTLDFFSKRFNIRRELMSWGLQEVNGDEGTVYVPVVMINNSPIFIDIKKDCFLSKSTPYGRTTKFFPANMVENEKGYVFSASDKNYILTKEDVKDFYDGKVMF